MSNFTSQRLAERKARERAELMAGVKDMVFTSLTFIAIIAIYTILAV